MGHKKFSICWVESLFTFLTSLILCCIFIIFCFSDKELWKIDPDDRHEESIEDGHFDTYEEQCSYCKQIGHCSRECLDPTKPIVCSMCGDIDHNLFQCQFAMCLNVSIFFPSFCFCLMCDEISAKFGLENNFKRNMNFRSKSVFSLIFIWFSPLRSL